MLTDQIRTLGWSTEDIESRDEYDDEESEPGEHLG